MRRLCQGRRFLFPGGNDGRYLLLYELMFSIPLLQIFAIALYCIKMQLPARHRFTTRHFQRGAPICNYGIDFP